MKFDININELTCNDSNFTLLKDIFALFLPVTHFSKCQPSFEKSIEIIDNLVSCLIKRLKQ